MNHAHLDEETFPVWAPGFEAKVHKRRRAQKGRELISHRAATVPGWKEAQEAIKRGREAAQRFRNNELVAEGIDHEALRAFHRIERLVSRSTGISIHDLRSESRSPAIAQSRMCIMYWARRRIRISYPKLGRIMGRDHSSIVLGCRSYLRRRAEKGRALRHQDEVAA